MAPVCLPDALHPLWDAIEAAEGDIHADRPGRALAHLTCARILLQTWALAQEGPAARAPAADARLVDAVRMRIGEPAEVIDLAARRATREARA